VLLKAPSIALPAGNSISLLGMLDQIEMEMYCIGGDFVGAKFRKNVTDFIFKFKSTLNEFFALFIFALTSMPVKMRNLHHVKIPAIWMLGR